MRNVNRIDRERWKRDGKAPVQPPRASVRVQKGFGPNKASGHKGGISRQGSKR